MEYFLINSVPRYAKSYVTLRIDKICYVFVSPALQISYVTLHYMFYVSINGVPQYAKSYATLH